MHQPVKYLPLRNRWIHTKPTLLFAALTRHWVYKLPVAWRLAFQNGLKCLGVWFFDFHQLRVIFSTDFHLELHPLQRLHLWSCCSKVPGWYQFSCLVALKVGHICKRLKHGLWSSFTNKKVIFWSSTAITTVAHHAQFSMLLPEPVLANKAFG